MSYNGYENYETWAVSLWLNNTAIDYQLAQIECEQLKSTCKNSDELIIKFAQWLKEQLNNKADYVRRQYHKTEYAYEQIIVDFLNNSIERVNWYEVAESLIED